jgi:dipeptidyl aminopeptidase/acylaminoacyl peptidase
MPTAVASAKVAYSLWMPINRSTRVGWIEAAALGRPRSHLITMHSASQRKLDYSPTWSPSGRRIAFVRSSRSNRVRGIFVVPGGGGRARRVATVGAKNAGAVYPLRWSPTGDRLVFDRYGAVECKTTRAFDLRFNISRADGRGTRTVHALPRPATLAQLGDIRWSPSGNRLLYIVYTLDDFGDTNECRFHRPEAALFVVNADGSHRTKLVDSEVYAATWSADGASIAYEDCAAAADAGCDLYLIRPDGSGKRLLQSERLSTGIDLSWSPLGDEVLATGYKGLYGVDVASGTERTIATWPESDVAASVLDFSGTGKLVALLSSYSYGGDFYPHRATVRIVSLNGGAQGSILVPAKAGRRRLGEVSVSLP